MNGFLFFGLKIKKFRQWACQRITFSFDKQTRNIVYVIVGTQPPKNFLYAPIIKVTCSDYFINDNYVMRRVLNFKHVRHVVFVIKRVNRILRIAINVKHIRIKIKVSQNWAKLMQNFTAARMMITGAKYKNFCIRINFQSITLQKFSCRRKLWQLRDLLKFCRQKASDCRE